MQPLDLKPAHKLVKNYYEALGQFGQLNIDHEMAVRSAFQNLLAGCGRKFDWTLVPEWKIQRPNARLITVDGALLDTFRLARGYWEAKDEHDDLDKEIRAKLDKGYPRNNIIFQAPERAVLFQHGIRQGLPEDIRDAKNLVELLKQFLAIANRSTKSGTTPLQNSRSTSQKSPRRFRRRSKSSAAPIRFLSNVLMLFTRYAGRPSIPTSRLRQSRRCWFNT